MSEEIIDAEATEIEFTDLFGRKKANNYAFASQRLVNWSDESQEIQADYFLEGDRNKGPVIDLFARIANTLGTRNENRLKSGNVRLPVDLLTERDLTITPDAIDHFIGRGTLEMNVREMLGPSGYDSYRENLKKAAEDSDPKALLNTFITEESAQKRLAENYPGYAKYFEEYRREVQANEFLPPQNESEEVLSLLSKMIRYPGAISQAELHKHQPFVQELNKYFRSKRIPSSEAAVKRMTDDLFDILIKYLTIPPKDEEPPSPKDQPNEEDGASGKDDAGEGMADAPSAESGDEGDDPGISEEYKAGFGQDRADENNYAGEERDKNAVYDMSQNNEINDSGVDVSRKNWEHQNKSHEEVLKELQKKSQEIARKSKLEKVEADSIHHNDLQEKLTKSFEKQKERHEPETKIDGEVEKFIQRTYASDGQVFRDCATSDRTNIRYEKLIKSAPMNRANVLKNKLKVQIRDYDFSVKGVKSGRLDTTKIAEAVQNVDTVYERIGSVSTSKVSVGVLIDESGSMSGSPMDAAVQTAMMIEHALGKQSNVNLFIYGHHSSYMDCVVTRYVEPGYGNSKNLGASMATGANYDGDAIAVCAKRMRSLTEDPVLFFVISDGAPSAGGYGGDKAIRHVKKVVDFVEKKMNMQVVQVAIDSSVPSRKMFNHHVDFLDLNKLPTDLSRYVSTHLKNKLKTKVTM